MLRCVECFTLKMDSLRWSEKSIAVYQSTRRNFIDHKYRFEIFKSSDDRYFHIQPPPIYLPRPSGGCSPLLNITSHWNYLFYVILYTITLLYVCPGVLLAAGKTSYGIQGWFIESHAVFTICLCIYLYLRYKVYSYPVKHTKIISNKRITQLSLPSRNNNLCFQ